uniref:OmpA-OmpF porin, OOP family n=1 Tax=Candidatus Kentrum sp. LPFa TaxID=2126335 RepID=A0A450VM24_9GAMM|nr:MAG: OmpA-OmpF porin, OOP family [Candidatus Kentron sp. LPFa]
MKSLRNVLLILLAPLVVSGCATTAGKSTTCSIIGGATGGVIGATAEKAIWSIPGAIAGAALGYVLCQEGDADGDGVLDSKDLCKKTPPNTKVNKDGCSDFDKDGVFNNKDQCPNTLPGTKVDKKGCVLCGEIIAKLPGDVSFGSDKCDLNDEAKGSLGGVIKALKGTNTQIHIEGHTDSTGSDKYNLKLSQCRADSVKDYLASSGIGNKITAEGKGEASPKASNKTKAGRAENRRAEIIVTCK